MNLFDFDMCESSREYKKENKLFCKTCRSDKAKARACKKCENDDKFMAKHSDMCEEICEVSMTDDMAEDVAEDVKEMIKKKKKDKKKDEKKKDEKKDEKKKTKKKNKPKKTSTKKVSSLVVDMDIDEDEIEDEVEIVSAEKTQAEIEDEKLGVFGKILRAVIVANTWVTR